MSVSATKTHNLRELFNVVDQRTLIISGFGYFIGKKSERLIIKKKKEVIAQYAMSDLDEIIITSRGASISTSLIKEACKRGIKICIWSNSYPNVMISSPQLAAFAEVKRAQFAALDKEIGLNLVKKALESKISNQAALIKYSIKNKKAGRTIHIMRYVHSIQHTLPLLNNVEGHSLAQARLQLLNIEATAARVYWKAFASVLRPGCGFEARDHESEDIVNISINYGYAILYSLTWMSILNAGLEPFAGFLHTDRPGKPSLVLDLSEPFKPRIVDKVVLSIINRRQKITLDDGMLSDDSKKLLSRGIIAELEKKEYYSGKRLTMRSIIQSNIYSVANMLKGNGNYEKYLFKW
ncbi:MAG: CRISPR-associated endonuclease Cas1 [Candidatus Micrarchaeaceae archaeon]